MAAAEADVEELADLLGIAPETISRWENGAVIQSRAMDNLVRLFFSVPEVERALRNPVRLSCATPRPRLSRKSRRAS